MEILTDIRISQEEENLLDMHSVLNVLNVVLYELILLSQQVDNPQSIDEVTGEIAVIADKLKDRNQALHQVENIDHFAGKILAAIETAEASCRPEKRAVVDQAQKNLLSIFDVLKVRAKEITARAENPNGWVEHDIQQLKNNFSQVFQAIEQNSKGRYRILKNIALQDEEDYFITLEIDSENGSVIAMPAVFQDVMRDLIANARKYTPPGGEIIASLYQGGNELTFVVEDTGYGIPESEIASAVQFGYRGTNVHHLPTKGGGFGLTKAHYVTKAQGGRIWIDKRKEGGTRIKIILPVPSQFRT
jgi:signal transduction histidine kinase